MSDTRTAVSRAKSGGITTTLTLEIPTDCPLTDLHLESRAQALAALAIGTFGLTPTQATAFLTAVIRTLRRELGATVG